MTQVRITVAEDESQPFGHARITFPASLGSGSILPLTIMRKSADKPYLGSAGWQAPPVTVNAYVTARTPNSTTVVVGPEVCERILVELQVRIEASGHDMWGSAFWPEVAPAMEAWSEDILLRRPESVMQEEVKAPPALKPAPPPLPPVSQPSPLPDLQPAPVEPQPPSSEPPIRKTRWGLYALIFLLLLGGGGWFVVQDSFRSQPTESFAERFERLKQTDPEGDDLASLSEEAFAAGDAEIGRGALLLAFERGNLDAKLALARLYDPRFADPARLPPPDAPNANLAGRYYMEMCFGGHAEAARLLASLCTESTAAGSSHAAQFSQFDGRTYCEGDCGQ